MQKDSKMFWLDIASEQVENLICNRFFKTTLQVNTEVETTERET